MESIVSIVYLYFLILNIVGFMVMGKDKKKAIRNEYRIKETTLWAIALAGGSIGAYAGMRIYRHKTKHTLFRFGFPLLVMVHSLLFIWINTKI
ncbi:DUF1294 domain-containing protein [Rossellomorea aquimaris]|uniref:DUF1294 domain-containing protein n=1 Tax=Rossellomorea aquimaris TaxID=189382 RepID=UPI0007D06F4F|nr:DUF1294 domain-containing protein [Rossellomorea aquimaris]